MENGPPKWRHSVSTNEQLRVIGSKPSRRQFLQSGAQSVAGVIAAAGSTRAPAVAPSPAVKPFELDEATISALQEGMKSGRFKARSLVEKYLRRTEEIDRQGPGVNAVIEINPDALAIATSLDEEPRLRVRAGQCMASLF